MVTKGRRAQRPASDPALVAELRQIEADWRTARNAANAGFREAWAAKVATEPARRPIHVSKFIGSR